MARNTRGGVGRFLFTTAAGAIVGAVALRWWDQKFGKSGDEQKALPEVQPTGVPGGFQYPQQMASGMPALQPLPPPMPMQMPVYPMYGAAGGYPTPPGFHMPGQPVAAAPEEEPAEDPKVKRKERSQKRVDAVFGALDPEESRWPS